MGDGPTGPSAEAGGGVCVGLSISSVSPQLYGVGSRAPRLIAGNWGSPSHTLPKRTEPSCALTTRSHCLLQAGSGHPAVGPDAGLGLASCGALLSPAPARPLDTPGGLSHVPGVGWDSMGATKPRGGVRSCFSGFPMRKGFSGHALVRRYRKPNSELGNVNTADAPPGIWCPRETPPS